HCRRIAAGMCEWLTANGADVRTDARVASVEPDVATVVLASGERLTGDRIVVTAGAWVLKLFPQLGSSLKTYRTAVTYAEPPADLRAAWAAAPVILDVGGRIDGYIVPPSGEGGLKFGTGMHKWPTDDADADRSPREGEGVQILGHFSPPIARIDEYRVERVVTC